MVRGTMVVSCLACLLPALVYAVKAESGAMVAKAYGGNGRGSRLLRSLIVYLALFASALSAYLYP